MAFKLAGVEASCHSKVDSYLNRFNSTLFKLSNDVYGYNNTDKFVPQQNHSGTPGVYSPLFVENI